MVRVSVLMPYVIFNKICRFIFQKKLTKSGKLQLKFFKIPISIKLLSIEETRRRDNDKVFRFRKNK